MEDVCAWAPAQPDDNVQGLHAPRLSALVEEVCAWAPAQPHDNVQGLRAARLSVLVEEVYAWAPAQPDDNVQPTSENHTFILLKFRPWRPIHTKSVAAWWQSTTDQKTIPSFC